MQEPRELHALLVGRQLIFSSAMAATFAALMAAVFWTGTVQQLGGASFVRFSILSLAVPLVVAASAACLLRWHTPTTVGALRTLELLITGTVAAAILWGMTRQEWYGLLEHGPEIASPREFSAFRGAYTESTSLRWFALLVGYGAVIPNTWRRCTAVVTVLAISPLFLFAVLSLWMRPLPTDVAVTVLSVLALWIGVAVIVVVFTAYRIEVLGQQAAEAGKLGQYLLKQRLGSGGMGEVYLAEHLLLRRPCAVKLIRREQAGDPTYVQRFEREVRLTATLTHPNTIQVFDYGRTDDDTFYYVMEYLKSFSLEQMVSRHGPLPAGRAIYLLRQVCAALREAHAIGLLHRDIKPGNVLVCERGGEHDVIKLLDFGLVLPLTEGDGDRLTQDAAIAGTPAYMSPEQAAGDENLDARSDIYSVGALAYFLLSGHPPFVHPSAVKTLAAHLHEMPSRLTSSRPDIPGDLEATVLRCLAKNRANRFANAESLEAALAACGAAASWSSKEAATWWRRQNAFDDPGAGSRSARATHS
jgi:serine/threonine-protein kinase